MAKLPIEIHPEASAEEDEAFFYYRDRSFKAAESFVQELEKAREAIQNSPESWPKYMRGTRRYRLQRYPYVVVYRTTESRIEVVAIAHGRRRPGYWADRLKRDK